MDTNAAHRLVITYVPEKDAESEQAIVIPVAVGFSAPTPQGEGEWMLIAHDEESGQQRAFPLIGMEIDAMGDAHTEQLKQIIADREAAVPVAADPSSFVEGENAVSHADLTLVKDSE